MTMSDRKDCMSEMPEALMAVSSLLSPRLPNVMSDESRIARGSACGTSMSAMYQKNCAMTSMVRPLPMSSSIYLHRNCIINTNWQMKNVPTKSSPNCLAMKISNFFGRSILSDAESDCKDSIKKSDAETLFLLSITGVGEAGQSPVPAPPS